MLVYFKVPSQNVQLIWHKPPEPLCAGHSWRSHKAGLGTGSAAPQSAVSTPCILCSAAGPVLLNISQSPQPPTQHPPMAWKTFTTIILLGLCWAVKNLKGRFTLPQLNLKCSVTKENNPRITLVVFLEKKELKKIFTLFRVDFSL